MFRVGCSMEKGMGDGKIKSVSEVTAAWEV